MAGRPVEPACNRPRRRPWDTDRRPTGGPKSSERFGPDWDAPAHACRDASAMRVTDAGGFRRRLELRRACAGTLVRGAGQGGSLKSRRRLLCVERLPSVSVRWPTLPCAARPTHRRPGATESRLRRLELPHNCRRRASARAPAHSTVNEGKISCAGKYRSERAGQSKCLFCRACVMVYLG